MATERLNGKLRLENHVYEPSLMTSRMTSRIAELAGGALNLAQLEFWLYARLNMRATGSQTVKITPKT